MVLGNGAYALNLQALKAQKVSEGNYTAVLKELRKKHKNQVSWETIQASLKEYFGFWDTIQLRKGQEEQLKAVYEKSFGAEAANMERNLYQQNEPLAGAAKRILNQIALVSWASYWHRLDKCVMGITKALCWV